MEQPPALLERYRSDRNKLLEFLLSSGLVTELRTRSGPTASLCSVNLDALSADYILDRIKSGGVIDVGEATETSRDEAGYPVMIYSEAGNSYFTVSDPESAGSPPRRAPPKISVNQTAHLSSVSIQMDRLHVEKNTTSYGDDADDHRNKTATSTPERPPGNGELPPLGLPRLNTGLSDDDMRESAYELLLASVSATCKEQHPVDDRKKEKNSKFLTRLKSRRDKIRSQPVSSGQKELMDSVRVQMQISEIMDACIRRNLLQLVATNTGGQIDIAHISLGLLNGVFKSDFLNEKSYRQWKTRQANMLEEFLCFSADAVTTECQTIRSSVEKIRDAKQWDALMSPAERVAVLASIRQVVLKYSSFPGKFSMEGETYYWTAAYHLNFRLYQKLLFGVFDVLDEGQLIEGADKFIALLKLTWPTLGVTQKLHNALYGWVLFQQFVGTNEGLLLEYATLELQKLFSTDEGDWKEEQYMNSLICSTPWNSLKLSLVQAIFLSISNFCDSKMHDYHLNFCQKPSNFRMMMTLLSVVGVPPSGNTGEIKLIKLNASDNNTSKIIKSYVKSSTEATYRRIASKIELEGRKHYLALLAKEVKSIAEREFKIYYPVLCHWCPESLVISVVLLHQFYGERLKPFLGNLSSLTDDVRSVLPAADMLDNYLSELYDSASDTHRSLTSFNQNLNHYKIGELSKPLVLDWVISQHARIFEWTGRAFDIEDWEPLSFHQKQAASIVEVFRIIEETVDQLFGMNLPMDITHLQALLSIIFHSLDAYLLKMLNQLVEKNHLYPLAAPLTRYTETVMPMIKRKLLESALPDDNMRYKLNELTISKLCIRLNTLEYIRKQVGLLEDGIRKSWAAQSHNRWTKAEAQEEAIDALFATTLSIIRDTATDSIKKLCNFAGARVVFWDLRDRFLFQLYRGEVMSSRLENFIPYLDTVLDQICGLIDDNLRDLLVLSVCRASLEGFVWILLDGGPSRAFSDSDVIMMQDDLTALKELFIADGEGLPRSLVEQEARFAGHILGLFSLQTETVIQMLMTASEQISQRSDLHRHGQMPMEDAHNLIRVLCHKKDREASKFLKRQYELPMASDYDDTPSAGDSVSRSPFIPDLLGSNSFHWNNRKGETSFRSLKKKLQDATSEIRNMSR